MLSFSRLTTFFDICQTKTADDAEIAERLGEMFAEAGPLQARDLAYLCTARLGAPYAPRIPWISMTAQRLLDRFKRERVDTTKTEHGRASVAEVYAALHAADPIRPDWYPNRPELAQQMISLARTLSEKELGWLVTLMLGRSIVSDRLVFLGAARAGGVTDFETMTSIAKQITTRFNKCVPDIGLVAQYILDLGVDKALVELGKAQHGIPVPLEEMEAKSRDEIAYVFRCLGSHRIFVQAKSDGIYLQLHKNQREISVFDEGRLNLAGLVSGPELDSRTGSSRQRTGKYESQAVARVAEIMAMLRALKCERAILDAEVVGVDHGKDRVVTRAATFQAPELQIIVFDLVALDTDCRFRPYEERRNLLRELVEDTPPTFASGVYLAEEVSASSTVDAMYRFDYYTKQNRYEGVVLKNPDSRLSPRLHWTMKRVKVKNRASLDMLLVGYYYSEEKKKPTKYLCALRDPASNRYRPCGAFVAESTLESKLNDYCKLTGSDMCPSDVIPEGQPNRWTGTDLVVEVETDGLITANDDQRFPGLRWVLHQGAQRMIVAIREDKSKDRVNSIDRLLSLKHAPGF